MIIIGNHYVRASLVKYFKTNGPWHFFFTWCKEEHLVVIVYKRRICNHGSCRDIWILKIWLTFNSYDIAKNHNFRASSINTSRTNRPWHFSSTWNTEVYLFVILCERQVYTISAFIVIDVSTNLLNFSSAELELSKHFEPPISLKLPRLKTRCSQWITTGCTSVDPQKKKFHGLLLLELLTK